MTDGISPDSPDVSSLEASQTISQTIDRLRQLTQLDVQAGWRLYLGDLPVAAATQPESWKDWRLAELDDRHHINWEKGQQVLWLGQTIQIPSDLQGYPLEGLSLRLALGWWAEFAQVFVNGTLVQEGDLFDCAARILLTAAAQPGETIQVALRLVSPGHDGGALVRSTCLYEVPDSADCPEPGFVADEMAVLQQYLSSFAPEKLEVLATALAQIEWSSAGSGFDGAAAPQVHRSLARLRQQLEPIGRWVKQRQIQLVGHAHLDLAWLWTVSETWDVAERTFRSVLQLQQDFPALTFCHSTPALYEWVERHRPDLFAQIQAQIAAQRWEVVAGLWVEPELNLVCGESIARQILYGQRYVQEKFGNISKVAWLPDSFGFCWQLPQLLRQGGVEFFVTQKLRWNDTTEFPHELFWWRSPDGTQILCLNSAPIGEGIDPLKMTRHACTWETKTQIPRSLWLPGVGDHGGGPTRDMLETAQRWERSPFFPNLKFTTVADYLQQVSADEPRSAIPVWNDELYLEFHRGCYTTHAAQKRSNRKAEILLYQAELFASIATIATQAAYPQSKLEAAWKQVLFNQFHDILPGSAIPGVFVDANRAWREAEQTAQQILSDSLNSIAAHIALPPPPHPDSQPIAVFNSLNWDRSEVVVVALPSQHGQIYDCEGEPIAAQRQIDESGTPHLLFRADVPSVGYRVFWLSPIAAATAERQETPPWTLENEALIVEVDPITGDLKRVFDKRHQREVLSGRGNQLQAFADRGQYWDAWNIDPSYAEHPLPPARMVSIAWVDRGLLQQRLRVVRQIGQSRFCQDYVLEQTAVLRIETQVDWQERHVLVKAAFPLSLRADRATYEIPFGAIERSTQPTTPQEQAKWEVPALQWADLSEADYGVSLLNDCKYGYDAQPSQLRLTLLRGSEWPDPHADLGHHEFTYALYPHGDRWQAAQTVRRGYELNQPLQVIPLPPGRTSASLPPARSFLSLQLTRQAPSLVLAAFKRMEDDPTQWILRCYESEGKAATLDSDLQITRRLDLLERPTGEEASLEVSPWTIATCALQPQWDS